MYPLAARPERRRRTAAFFYGADALGAGGCPHADTLADARFACGVCAQAIMSDNQDTADQRLSLAIKLFRDLPAPLQRAAAGTVETAQAKTNLFGLLSPPIPWPNANFATVRSHTRQGLARECMHELTRGFVVRHTKYFAKDYSTLELYGNILDVNTREPLNAILAPTRAPIDTNYEDIDTMTGDVKALNYCRYTDPLTYHMHPLKPSRALRFHKLPKTFDTSSGKTAFYSNQLVEEPTRVVGPWEYCPWDPTGLILRRWVPRMHDPATPHCEEAEQWSARWVLYDVESELNLVYQYAYNLDAFKDQGLFSNDLDVIKETIVYLATSFFIPRNGDLEARDGKTSYYNDCKEACDAFLAEAEKRLAEREGADAKVQTLRRLLKQKGKPATYLDTYKFALRCGVIRPTRLTEEFIPHAESVRMTAQQAADATAEELAAIALRTRRLPSDATLFADAPDECNEVLMVGTLADDVPELLFEVAGQSRKRKRPHGTTEEPTRRPATQKQKSSDEKSVCETDRVGDVGILAVRVDDKDLPTVDQSKLPLLLKPGVDSFLLKGGFQPSASRTRGMCDELASFLSQTYAFDPRSAESQAAFVRKLAGELGKVSRIEDSPSLIKAKETRFADSANSNTLLTKVKSVRYALNKAIAARENERAGILHDGASKFAASLAELMRHDLDDVKCGTLGSIGKEILERARLSPETYRVVWHKCYDADRANGNARLSDVTCESDLKKLFRVPVDTEKATFRSVFTLGFLVDRDGKSVLQALKQSRKDDDVVALPDEHFKNYQKNCATGFKHTSVHHCVLKDDVFRQIVDRVACKDFATERDMPAPSMDQVSSALGKLCHRPISYAERSRYVVAYSIVAQPTCDAQEPVSANGSTSNDRIAALKILNAFSSRLSQSMQEKLSIMVAEVKTEEKERKDTLLTDAKVEKLRLMQRRAEMRVKGNRVKLIQKHDETRRRRRNRQLSRLHLVEATQDDLEHNPLPSDDANGQEEEEEEEEEEEATTFLPLTEETNHLGKQCEEEEEEDDDDEWE